MPTEEWDLADPERRRRIGKLPYPCLVIDHDDTTVMSTPSIHYPAHVETLRRLRPGQEPVGLHTWLEKNFHPGLRPFLELELGFDGRELVEATKIWREFTSSRVPEFFPGMVELLADFKTRGGVLVVVSHSEEDMIRRDYRAASADLSPDLVFGWSEDEERRKPHPYPVLEAMARLGRTRNEVLVLDDLKPGADMAQAAGVAFAAAGWGHSIPAIRACLETRCLRYFETIKEFGAFILPSGQHE